METAINSINSEKQYLNDYFNSSSASSQTAPTAARLEQFIFELVRA